MSSFIISCGAIGLWNTGTFSKLVIMSVSCTCIFIVLTTLNMNFRILDQRPLSSMSRANTFVTSLKTMKRIDTLDKSMKRVLILTMGRSVSSLLGDVLDHHKNVVYYFEPLFTNQKMLQQKFSTNKRYIKVKELLEEYLSCKFSEEDHIFLKSFFSSDFRFKSTALSKPPFCPNITNLEDNNKRTYYTSYQKVCRHKSVDPASLYNICMGQYTHTVVKEFSTRIPQLTQFLNEASPPLKIVQLVRDPRAIYVSIKKAGWKIPHDDIHFRCNSIMEVAQLGTNSLEKGTGHYRVCRYEDIYLNFNLEIQRLINFVDLPW